MSDNFICSSSDFITLLEAVLPKEGQSSSNNPLRHYFNKFLFFYTSLLIAR